MKYLILFYLLLGFNCVFAQTNVLPKAVWKEHLPHSFVEKYLTETQNQGAYDYICLEENRIQVRHYQQQLVEAKDTVGYERWKKQRLELWQYINCVTDSIYLSTIAQGIQDFTAPQIAQLEAIVYQCPLVTGRSIYKARAMYRLVNDSASYADADACFAQGMAWRTQAPAPLQTHEVYDTVMGANKYDAVWVFGYGGVNATSPFGGVKMDFNYSPPK